MVHVVVLKFGGKSLESEEKIYNVCEHIKFVCQTQKVVVVVSAIGDTTDKLFNFAQKFCKNCQNSREIDAILAAGEIISAGIVSQSLSDLGVKSISKQAWQLDIIAMGKHGQAVITGINKSKILELFKQYSVVVVTGFQAINKNGDICTIGRGGSDTSAVALGAVLGCEVEIYSNFDGIYAGDPSELNYKKLQQIDFCTMQTLSNNGAKVLSAASVDIARQANINLVCKQSSCPQKSGTHISNVPIPFVGITTIDNLCEIDIIYNSNENNLQKTAKYIVQSVKYHKFCIKTNKITLILKQSDKMMVLNELAKINNLLED